MSDTDDLFGALITLCPDPIVLLQDGKYRQVNQAFVDLFGYTYQQVRDGLSFMAMVPESGREAVQARHQARLAGEELPQTFQLNLMAKDGSLIPCETSERVIEFQGAPADLVIIRNILKRIATQLALFESGGEYRQLFDNVLEGIYQTTPDGRILKANKALANMLGHDSTEDCCKDGINVVELYADPEERAGFVEQLERDGYLRNIEYCLKRRDGSIITVLENARVVRDKQGKVLHYEGILTDITERIEAELAMRESEAKYRTLYEDVPVGLFRSTPDGELLSVNRSLVKMLGYESASELQRIPTSDIYVDPDRRQELMSRVLKDGSVENFEIRAKRGDGSHIWVSTSIRATFDDEGNILFLDGTGIDITERKQAEESLAATLDALPDMLFEIDRDGHIHDYRAHDSSLLFVPPSEFIGKTIRHVLPQAAADVIMEAVEKTVSTGRCHGLMYALDIDDRKHWFELSMSIKGSPTDPNSHFIGLVRDITEWRRTDERLRNATSELVIERQALREKNITLQQVLNHLQSKVDADTRRAYSALNESIRPLLQKILERVPSEHEAEVSALHQTLDAILTRDLDDHRLRMSRLTSRETEICKLISSGMTSKEVAEQLGTSPATVNKHREAARRKLDLTGKPISLSAYLRTHRRTNSETGAE